MSEKIDKHVVKLNKKVENFQDNIKVKLDIQEIYF